MREREGDLSAMREKEGIAPSCERPTPKNDDNGRGIREKIDEREELRSIFGVRSTLFNRSQLIPTKK